jgi:hypothetical protein
MSISPLTPLLAAAGTRIAGHLASGIAGATSSFATFFQARPPASEAKGEASVAPPDSVIAADSLERTAERALQEFQVRLAERLAAVGGDSSLRYRLRSDTDGRVRVEGPHPRRERIEQAINADPQLRTTFRYLEATYQLIEAARQYQRVTESWGQDAGLAPMEPAGYGQNHTAFSLLVNGDRVEPELGRPGDFSGPTPFPPRPDLS